MALELKDLSEPERLALVALLEVVVAADAHATDGEAKQLARVVRDVGKKTYETTAEEVDRSFKDKAELRSFLATITRREARELIYETVLEVALADAPMQAEAEVLEWLAGIWDIDVQVVKE